MENAPYGAERRHNIDGTPQKEVTLDFRIFLILLIKGYFIEFLVSNIVDKPLFLRIERFLSGDKICIRKFLGDFLIYYFERSVLCFGSDLFWNRKFYLYIGITSL